jgi:ribonuclease E
LIDDKEIFKQTRDFFKTVMPDHVKLVKLHQERRPIFARYQIEEQIAQLASNSVNLPSGGSIVLDQTEALVAIDVNSGKVSSEQSIESTACLVNVEAATEIARQLRLRDLGGLVVIDFIDMRQRKNARKVEKTLEQALKQDKARITQGRISSLFGLLEMSRQRIKPNLGASSYNSCPHCSGSGRIRSCESRAISLLRRIQAGTAKGKIDRVVANVALDVGVLLLNQKRTELKELEQQQNIEIWIKPQPDHLPDQVDIDFIKDSGEHDDTNGEQKALVDMDYSERSYDIDSDEDKSKGSDDAKDKQDKESAAPQGGQDKDSEQQDDRKDGSKETNGDKPRRPRRSRSSRQRRARADTKGNEDANKETSANSSANDSDVEQKPQVEEEKFASSGTADVQTSPPQAQSKDQESGSAPARPKSSSGRTRRRKPQSSSDSAKAQQSSAQNNEQSTSSQAQENSGSEDKSAQDTETEQPKAKRAPARRRPSSKKTENNGGAESATDSNSTEVSAEEQPKTQRKRTPSRRSTPVKSAKKSASVTEATSVPEESPAPPKQAGEESGKAAQDEGNKTPAPRKRTPRKRTTSKDTATVVASESDSKDSGTKADTSAPDERKNRDINEPVIKQGENAQESEAKKPAPARKRRTSTKKVSAEGGEDTSTASEEKTPAKKTSRRRASTTRRKSAESTTSTQAPDNEVRQSTGAAEPLAEKEVAENAKPAPKRTTRRTAPRRSKSTSTPEEKTSTDSGSEGESKSEATLQRRRTPARRKTTPKPEDEA